MTKAECEDACGELSQVYDTGAEIATIDDSPNGLQKIPPVPAEVFDEMRRITIMYSEHYREFTEISPH